MIHHLLFLNEIVIIVWLQVWTIFIFEFENNQIIDTAKPAYVSVLGIM